MDCLVGLVLSKQKSLVLLLVAKSLNCSPDEAAGGYTSLYYLRNHLADLVNGLKQPLVHLMNQFSQQLSTTTPLSQLH